MDLDDEPADRSRRDERELPRIGDGWAAVLTGPFRSSLAGKFSLVLLALLIPLVFVGMTASRGLSTNAEELLRARRVKELAALSLSLVLTQDDVTKEILLDESRITEAQRKIEAYDANLAVLDQIAALTESPELRATLAGLRELDDEVLRPLDGRVLEALSEQGAAAAQQIYFFEYQPVRVRYLSLARQLMEQAEDVAVRAETLLEARNRRSMLEVAAALVVGIGLVAAITLAITRHVRRRLASVVDVLERVAEGDLRTRLEADSHDEIGRMATALNRAVESMAGALVQTSRSAGQVQGGTRSIALASRTLARTAADQRRELSQVSSSMDQVTAQVWDIAETVRALRSLVETAGAAVGEMEAGVERIGVATDVLSRGAEATSSSMLSMAREMDAADRIASQSAELWQRMVDRGEQARSKVRLTVEGVEAIRESTRSAESVVRGVGARADEIGTILDVIDAVADETKLLALNAAIIAAQAGERGKAFSVVAGEIGSLAQRVTLNTKEIERLIRAVQQESANAIEVMDQGGRSIDAVVGLSSEAGAAVEEITRSSKESGEQVREIARAVQDQNRAAHEIVELMRGTEAAIGEIRSAVSSHGAGNEMLVAATEFMQQAARQICDTAIELVRSAQRLGESVDGVKGVSGSVEAALQAQIESTQSILDFLEKVGKRSSENSRSAELTSEATRELSDQSDALLAQVLRFEL